MVERKDKEKENASGKYKGLIDQSATNITVSQSHTARKPSQQTTTSNKSMVDLCTPSKKLHIETDARLTDLHHKAFKPQKKHIDVTQNLKN